VLPHVNRRVLTYGTSAQADLTVRDIRCGHLASLFTLSLRGEDLGEFEVTLPGMHNVLNATATVAVGLELQLTPAQIAAGLKSFTGVDRRFQVRGEVGGVTVIDDYGHHPTEVRATLDAARRCSFAKVHVLFQPHRYSRTHHLMDDFARAFHQADDVYVTDVYAASEQPIEGATGEALAQRLRDFGHRAARYVGTLDAGIEQVTSHAKQGDAIITLGAGTVSQAGDLILSRLRDRV
jgi:UDP-N-acetylmuramate--alanine ligase